MMLFWAGLRGAVGVALATGITGENADALRTTILVVVVLTVIVFGGTTARMLEVLGIRVGVEDEDASSDEEGEPGWSSHSGGLALQMGPGSRRFAGQNGRGMFGEDLDDAGSFRSPHDSPYADQAMPLSAARRSIGRASGRPGMLHTGSRSGFSTNSSDSEEVEPLPSAEATMGTMDIEAGEHDGQPNEQGMVFRDGKWFTALDERYLLPLFSNSVASRRHHAKRASRKASVYSGESGQNSPRTGQSMDVLREEDDNDADSESGKGKMPKNFG